MRGEKVMTCKEKGAQSLSFSEKLPCNEQKAQRWEKNDILRRKKLRQRRVSRISSTLERTCLLGLDTSGAGLHVLSLHIATAHLPLLSSLFSSIFG